MSRRAYEELLMSPVGALTPYRDADGRPLCGEALITDPEFRAQLELKRCPYAGSRKHHELPMNVSALKQMTRTWDDALGAVRLLRRLLGAGTEVEGSLDEELNGQAQLMRVAYAAVCLPLYLLHRERSPMRDGEVPGFVSGLHKASIDIATATQLALVRACSGAHGGEKWTGTLLEFVEREGLLIGPAGVCAGPPHMIQELVAAMSGAAPASNADGGEVELALGPLPGLVRYVDSLLEMMAIRHLVGAWIRRHTDALVARAEEVAATLPAARLLAQRVREAMTLHPVPTRPSEIIQRQDRWIRALPPAEYAALLDAIERGAAALPPSSSRAAGLALLEYARGPASNLDEAMARQMLQLSGLTDEPLLVELVEAIARAARLQQLALAFFAANEASIASSLSASEASPSAPSPLPPAHFDRVFGASPARYLGELVALDVEVTGERIHFRRRGASLHPLVPSHP